MKKKEFDCIASVVVYDTDEKIVNECLLSFLDTKLRVCIYIVNVGSNIYTFPEDERIHILNSNVNLGYGKGNNLSLQNSPEAKYFLVLNPDVFIKEDCLEKMIQFMDRNERIGISIPQVFNLDGTRQYLNKREPNILALFVRRFVPKIFHFLFKNTLDHYEMRDLYQEENYEVPFVSGAFMLCRKKVLMEVNGFDPNYFLYFEDADLCKKVQNLNYRTVYFSKAKIIHLWRRGAHKDWKLAIVFIKSMVHYFNKWGWKFF
jgi:hypothetical protein